MTWPQVRAVGKHKFGRHCAVPHKPLFAVDIGEQSVEQSAPFGSMLLRASATLHSKRRPARDQAASAATVYWDPRRCRRRCPFRARACPGVPHASDVRFPAARPFPLLGRANADGPCRPPPASHRSSLDRLERYDCRSASSTASGKGAVLFIFQRSRPSVHARRQKQPAHAVGCHHSYYDFELSRPATHHTGLKQLAD